MGRGMEVISMEVVEEIERLSDEVEALKAKCMKLEEEKEFFRKSLEAQSKEMQKKGKPF